MSTSKRKRDEAPAATELPAAAVTAADGDMRDAPSVWAEESDKEDF
jgi:hypothetical protein